MLLVDVNADGLEDVAGKARALGAADVAWTTQDLSREEGGAAIAKWRSTVGNASTSSSTTPGGNVIRPFLQHTAETLRRQWTRNLWTDDHGARRAVLPPMIERNYGRIVNISADSVHTGAIRTRVTTRQRAASTASPPACAFEFAKHNITVNSVSPGGIATPEIREMLDPNSEVYKKHRIVDVRTVMAMIPIGRFVEMNEVAALTAFLTYEETRGITGQIYSVNGGQWMM